MGWLALDLQPNETVHLGPMIRVCLVRQKRAGATVAIAAPPTINIWRAELIDRDPTLANQLGEADPFAGLADLIGKTIDAIPRNDAGLDHAADARRVLRRLLAEITATLATPPAPTKATP